MKIYSRHDKRDRYVQLVELLNDYYVIGHRENSRFLSELWFQSQYRRIRNRRVELAMFELKEDVEDELPVFCVGLIGGGFATCYEKIVEVCECGGVLEECADCGGLVCPNGCDDGEEEKDET